MARASKLERFMLNLINQERADAGLRPLRFDGDLNGSSDRHSNWMLERDVFSHTGAGGSSATQRIKAAGYELSGSWKTGENIAWQSARGPAGWRDDVRDLHEALMDSPGHRANILSRNFDEIGIGIKSGALKMGGANSFGLMITQDFGRTAADTARQAQNAPAEKQQVSALSAPDPSADSFVFRDTVDSAEGSTWETRATPTTEAAAVTTEQPQETWRSQFEQADLFGLTQGDSWLLG